MEIDNIVFSNQASAKNELAIKGTIGSNTGKAKQCTAHKPDIQIPARSNCTLSVVLDVLFDFATVFYHIHQSFDVIV